MSVRGSLRLVGASSLTRVGASLIRVGANAIRVGSTRLSRVGADLSRRNAGRPGVSRPAVAASPLWRGLAVARGGSEAIRGTPSSVNGESREAPQGISEVEAARTPRGVANPSVQRTPVAVRVLSAFREDRDGALAPTQIWRHPCTGCDMRVLRPPSVLSVPIICRGTWLYSRRYESFLRSCLHRSHRRSACRAITIVIDGQRRLADVLVQPRGHTLFTTDRHQHQQREHAHAGVVRTSHTTGGQSSRWRRGRGRW